MMSNTHVMDISQRALQVWSVLALAAKIGTVVTYEQLARLTGLPQNSGNVLGIVFRYCKQHELPLLSSLVVTKAGVPGETSGDIYAGLDIAREHMRCYQYDWLAHGVPPIQELREASEAAAWILVSKKKAAAEDSHNSG
jgi:alkylated DNA nucleotide flippase Atl1